MRRDNGAGQWRKARLGFSGKRVIKERAEKPKTRKAAGGGERLFKERKRTRGRGGGSPAAEWPDRAVGRRTKVRAKPAGQALAR